MRAALLTGHGGLDMLRVRADVAVPVPAADEVLIAVTACGMNNTDVNTRIGWYAKSVTGPTSGDGADTAGAWSGLLEFPRIQGADPVGTVAAVGSEVDRSRIGERVLVDPWLRSPDGDRAKARYLGSEVDGGFAEYVAVPSGNAHRVDSDLTDVELAAVPCSYSTAEHMLERARVAEGHQVLVTGASGGVGIALVQLAKRRGARVVAVTSASKLDRVGAVGADVVLDRAEPGLADRVRRVTGGVDVFADVVGGPLFAPLLETVRRGGHYTTAGAIAGPIVELDLRTLYLHDLTLHGATVVPREVFANLVRSIEAGELRPPIHATYPLDQIASAQEALIRREHVGAIVIEIGH